MLRASEGWRECAPQMELEENSSQERNEKPSKPADGDD